MPTRTATTLPFTELEVATGNYDTSRATVDRIILHTMVGTWEGAAARFDDPSSKVSAHYGVKLDGTLIHWLEEFNTAYHAGDYPMNQRSIGIEHEDGWNGQPPEPIRPDVLYSASAKLIADICKYYNIPIDRSHILKHNEVSDQPTRCPDALDIDRIIKEAQAVDANASSTSPDPLQECLKQHDTLVQLSDAKSATIDQLTKSNEDKQNQIDSLSEQGAGLLRQVDDLTKANTSLKANVSAVQKQNADLQSQAANQNKSDSTAIDLGIESEQQLKDQTNEINKLAFEMGTTYPPMTNLIVAYQDMKAAHETQVQVNKNNLNRFQTFFTTFINSFFKRK